LPRRRSPVRTRCSAPKTRARLSSGISREPGSSFSASGSAWTPVGANAIDSLSRTLLQAVREHIRNRGSDELHGLDHAKSSLLSKWQLPQPREAAPVRVVRARPRFPTADRQTPSAPQSTDAAHRRQGIARPLGPKASVDTSKPATSGRVKTGHQGWRPRLVEIYFAASS
jgi:hypothetical protein